ncbi:SMI1/KNR4 family protein [Amycolatopsis minnesotensis]|uniref:Knr4/Smi1-like domain-containing protein n=1 Tax=Amycolatopsis minnesotensis TaxID=337894 RepID=A0ABN2RH19_9PSEU
MTDVERSWQRIMAWLEEHAPLTARTIRAPDADAGAFEDEVGIAFPAELHAWWGLMGGVDIDRDYRAGFCVPPFSMPLSVARARHEYASLAVSPDPTCCGPGRQHQREAGDRGGNYCFALVPIARDVCGDVLAVDLRPGDRHGHVMSWYAEEGFRPDKWSDVGTMLRYTADCFDPGGTEDVPLVNEEGFLRWDRR